MKTSKSKELIKKLRENDIISVTIQNDPIMSKYPTKFSNSLELIEHTISLPIYPSLLDEEISKIISVIKN